MAESPKIASKKKKSVNPRAEMHEINSEGQLVEKICQCFEVDDRFILGGVTCKFTKEEVALITDLSFYGKALDLQSKKIFAIRLLQKHFTDKHLHMKDVRAKLIQLYPSNEDMQDFMIIEDLRLFAERIRCRDARERVSLGYIGGCTAALMVDLELTIGQQEENLFMPHEEVLVLKKLKMEATQRRIKEGIIEGIGKRKLVEVSVESRGKKRRKEEKEGEGGGEEESRRKKKENKKQRERKKYSLRS
ncbi:hypothetical protein QJS10_CPA09g00762 [Acorus calamus]|uniref:Uncharacterized protein n=1 Tax=Acorus calamus TaxID=4465 RepID=A0AAV9EB49_ACOCL|nr:hypothetical protein QJS10_CPA09g00762 [Acorus calamus]